MALAAAAFVLGVWLCGVDWRGGKELSRSHWNDNAGDKDAVRPSRSRCCRGIAEKLTQLSNCVDVVIRRHNQWQKRT